MSLGAAQKAKVEKYLEKQIRSSVYGVVSMREWLTRMRDDGGKPSQETVRDYAKEERELAAWKANQWNIPWGNSAHPQTVAHNAKKAEIDAGYFKTLYRMNLPDGTSYVLTKTDFDFIKALEI